MKRTLSALCVLAGLLTIAAELPQEWNTVGHVKAAWEIRGSGFKAEDLAAYFVISDRDDLLEGTVPPGTPASGAGEQDLFCWKYGVKNSTCIAFRVSNVNDFSKKWTLCLDSSAGADSKLDLTVTRIESTLPIGVQVHLLDARENVIADFSGATEERAVTVKDVPLGEYTLIVSYVRPAVEISIAEGVELDAGWNLISLPFNEIIEAKIGDRSLFDHYAVYRMDTLKRSFVRVGKGAELEPGEGFWVYLPYGGVLTGRGKCLGGKNSTIPEYTEGVWQALGILFACDLDNATVMPVTGKLSTNAMRWDAATERFVSASGTPVEYVGYLLR